MPSAPIWGRRPMYQGWYGIGPSDVMLHTGAFNWTYTLGTGLFDPFANGRDLGCLYGRATRRLGSLDRTPWRHDHGFRSRYLQAIAAHRTSARAPRSATA